MQPPAIDDLLSVWEAADRSPKVLDSLCSDHPSLAPALRSFASALERADATFASASRADSAPPVFPGYKILKLLGEGGMGSVWQAVQLSTQRNVALKLLPAHHLSSPKAQARFEREVELASRLDHPHIARIYDSGLDRNVYYFSMELIEGVPIDQFPFPSLTSKLSTLLLAARALEYAHTRGILHRDLKPSNLLVSPPSTADGTPTPHLLDFGLAKDISGDLADPQLTLEAPFAGTPGYCSPEQARGDHAGVGDTRSDVFSLGLIAAQVLTGRHPYDLKLPPQKLIHHIATTAPDLTAVAKLPPDLRLILAKSLAFAPEDRYPSASALAADLDAFLTHRPISARKPSLLYTARKLLIRHRRAALASAAALLVLASTTTYFTFRLLSEGARSSRSAEVAAEANRFVSELLTAAHPDVSQGRTLTVQDILKTASARIDSSKLDPEVESQIRLTLGNTLYQINLYPDAIRNLRRAVELRTSLFGPNDEQTLSAKASLAQAIGAELPTFNEADSLFREIISTRQRTLGPAHPKTLEAAARLASLHGNHAKNDSLSTIVETYDPLFASATDLNPDVKLLWNSIQLNLYNQNGDFNRMVTAAKSILDTQLQNLGPIATQTLRARLNYGISLGNSGRFNEAVTELSEAHRLRSQIMGPEHPDTLYAALQLAIALTKLNRPDDAKPLLESILAVPLVDPNYHRQARALLNTLTPNNPTTKLSTTAPSSR